VWKDIAKRLVYYLGTRKNYQMTKAAPIFFKLMMFFQRN
jgi:hypothetical protein